MEERVCVNHSVRFTPLRASILRVGSKEFVITSDEDNLI
jgi:hypothetical protein